MLVLAQTHYLCYNVSPAANLTWVEPTEKADNAHEKAVEKFRAEDRPVAQLVHAVDQKICLHPVQ